MRTNFLLSIAMIIVVAGMQPCEALAQVSVSGFEAETQRRVSRSVYEYGLRVQVQNAGGELIGLTAETSSTSAATVIVDGALNFGNVAAGGSAQSTGLLLLRIDRRMPFDADVLVFEFDYDEPAVGAVLDGDPALPALASPTTVQETPTDPALIVGDTLLDKVVAMLAPTASIGDVNQTLQQYGAKIASRYDNASVVVLRVPPQPNVDALDALAERLSASPAFAVVLPAQQPSVQVLPPSPADDSIRHLQLTRFPAIYNALVDAQGTAAAIDAICPVGSPKPLVLVVDAFGRPDVDGLPPGLFAELAAELPGALILSPWAPVGSDLSTALHGYWVTAVGFARFDNGAATGAIPVPECFDIVLLPMQGLADIYANMADVIGSALAEDPSRRIVVNLSWSLDDYLGPDGRLKGPRYRLIKAFQWKSILRELAGALGLANLEDNVLFVVAAGNQRGNEFSTAPIERQLGLRRAEYGNAVSIVANDVPTLEFAIDPTLWRPEAIALSSAIYPAILAELQALGLDTDPPPGNVMTVGSVTNPGAIFEAPLESAFSDIGPDVWVTGESVETIGGNVQGTSFAAPQVSALAAAIWLLQPELTGVQVKALIEKTARDINDIPRIVDAYAALLATDLDPGAPDGVRGLLDEAPVREALLDVNRDGVFDDDDFLLFLEAFFTPAGVADLEAPIVSPVNRDWSRYDLNGDGFLGVDPSPMLGLGDRRDVAPFDLDAVFPVDLAQLQLLDDRVSLPFTFIDPITLAYDENRVTDLDVLCYYANTQLYRGDRSRVEDLGIDVNRCLEYRFSAQRPLRVMEQLEPLDLIRAEVRVPVGEYLALGIDIPEFSYIGIGAELTFAPPTLGRFNRSNPFSDAVYGIAPGSAEFGFSGVRRIEAAQVEVVEDDIVAARRDYDLSGCTAGPSLAGLGDTTVDNPLSNLVSVAGTTVGLRVTPFSGSACVLRVGKAPIGPFSEIPSQISDLTAVIGNAQSPPLSAGEAYLIETQSGSGLIVIGSTSVGGACTQRPDAPQAGYAWSASVSVFDLQPWVAPDWPSVGLFNDICGRDELAVIVSN